MQAIIMSICGPTAIWPVRVLPLLLQAHGQFVDTIDPMAQTPILLAAQHGRHEAVRMLVAAGTPVDVSRIVDGKGDHVLEAGYTEGDSDARPIHPQKRFGTTPLLLASGNGHHKIVEFLIANSADVNMTDSYGTTPIWCAPAVVF